MKQRVRKARSFEMRKRERKARAFDDALKLSDLLPPGTLLRVERVLHLAAIADEELRRAYPSRADEPDGLFHAVRPLSEDFIRKIDAVYRQHVRELVERAQRGESLKHGTKMEVLLGMLHTSTLAPLNRAGMILVERLWNELLPEHPFEIEAREQWRGQYEQLLDEARRKVRTGRT